MKNPTNLAEDKQLKPVGCTLRYLVTRRQLKDLYNMGKVIKLERDILGVRERNRMFLSWLAHFDFGTRPMRWMSKLSHHNSKGNLQF